MSQTTAAATTTIEQLATRYGEAWNGHDLDAIMVLHTDDAVFELHVPGAVPAEGREAVRAAFQGFLAQLPDIHFEQRRLRTGGGHWVMESVITGTVSAPIAVDGEEVAAAGEHVEVDAVDVIEVEGGRVRRKDTYLDSLDFAHQLGLEA
jgi:steroid delta-isomerase-like uncharacterized protein